MGRDSRSPARPEPKLDRSLHGRRLRRSLICREVGPMGTNFLPPETETSDKDRPLQEDIRLLGQILGDTVREQDGEGAFEIVEAIRRLSVAFQRNADAAAGGNLD